MGGKLIRPAIANGNAKQDGQIDCRERLGGLLKFYIAGRSAITRFESADGTTWRDSAQ